jgi:hypothetical protein
MNRSLRIFEMYQTYLQNGKFVSDFMTQNIMTFLEEAKKLGFKGLRTAGEMSWLNEHLEAITEANRYEIDVSRLCESNQNIISLCLYPVDRISGSVLQDVMHSHPSYVHNGRINWSTLSIHHNRFC